MNTNTDTYRIGTALPRWACKWWLRTKPPAKEGEGWTLYCPWWALPLDWLHIAIFGSCKLKEIDQ